MSRVQGSGTSIQQLPNGDLKAVDERLDVIIADMKDLFDHFKLVYVSSCSILNLVHDDQARFKIVGMVLKEQLFGHVLKEQLFGHEGEPKRLENLEAAIAAEEMKTAKGAKSRELTEKRASVRRDISSLKSDMNILSEVLRLPNVADLGTNASALVESIEIAVKNLSSQADAFFTIKTMLQAKVEDEVLKRIDSALADWKIITPEAEKLEKDFAHVVVLHLELEQLLINPWL